jgi:hypothetical protein
MWEFVNLHFEKQRPDCLLYLALRPAARTVPLPSVKWRGFTHVCLEIVLGRFAGRRALLSQERGVCCPWVPALFWSGRCGDFDTRVGGTEKVVRLFPVILAVVHGQW